MKVSYSNREIGSVASSFSCGSRSFNGGCERAPALLAQDVGDVVGAEGACLCGVLNRRRNVVRSVLPNQLKQFEDLAPKRFRSPPCRGARLRAWRRSTGHQE